MEVGYCSEIARKNVAQKAIRKFESNFKQERSPKKVKMVKPACSADIGSVFYLYFRKIIYINSFLFMILINDIYIF
ncbi:MAG: hypothetical protein B6I32_04145 [Desulfobacterium sp. 4572_20]|nr:MAG: hypothetical protein B6I32_04145 [Desulfobacterium sp. 4572_20]